MGRKRRLLCGLLTLVLAAGLCQTPAGAEVTWNKEPAAWAKEQMEDLADAGILGQGGYEPTYIMTRGQFCYFMVNLIHRIGNRDLLRETPPMPVNYFEDVESKDGYGGRYNVYLAAAYGLTEGALVDGKRLADLDNTLTREQAAKMMCSLLDSLGQYAGMEEEGAGAPKVFADADAISPWAKGAVDRASALGILKGDEAGRFNPQGVLTFQEACVMLDRAFRQGEEAALKRDRALGIQSLTSVMEEEADWSLGDAMTEMYWLEQGEGRSVLTLHREGHEKPGIWVESFDARGNSTGLKEIPVELEVCAGFYEGEEAYYLAFGQGNMEQDDSKEVYRIVQYDRNWNRLGAASVKGGESYTTQPYRSTSHVGMAEEKGTLVLHTSRLRYQSSDGLRHQSNITIKIRTSDMSVVSVSPRSPGNHVSHSFAQYVAFDEGEPVYADHGDAYPRGFALNLDMPVGHGKELNFFPFSGEIGDNTTNAIPGGLGISGDNYLFAGASSDQRGNDKQTYCNVFLATVSKAGYPDNSRVEVQWLTHFPKNEEEYVTAVRLVPMNSNTFVVMWQSVAEDSRTMVGGMGDFCYAVFDGAGNQVGETQRMENYVAPLNDPTVVGDRILWVRPEAGPYSVFGNSRARYLKLYELKIGLNEASEETSKRTETPKPMDTPRPTEAPDPAATEKPAEQGPASTVLPEDGITDSYCVNKGDGRWLKIEAVKGDTIRLTGCMPPELPSYYNYVVLQAYRKQAETPLVPGETFSLEVTIDAERFNEGYKEGELYYVTGMVCQNHRPGNTSLAGISFDGARISLLPDGRGGCTLKVIKE